MKSLTRRARIAGLYFSTNGYIPPCGQDRMPGYLRRAAKSPAAK